MKNNGRIVETLNEAEQEKVLLHFLATNQEQALLKYLRAGFTVTAPVALLICNLSKQEIITSIKALNNKAKKIFELYFEDWDNSIVDSCFACYNFMMAHAINREETCSRLIQKKDWKTLKSLGEIFRVPEEERLKI